MVSTRVNGTMASLLEAEQDNLLENTLKIALIVAASPNLKQNKNKRSQFVGNKDCATFLQLFDPKFDGDLIESAASVEDMRYKKTWKS